MSHGGRIVQHEKNHLSDPNTTLLLVGYRAVGSLGRQLEEGAKRVNIFGETINVRAKIEKINGYSSHRDSNNLVSFVESTASSVKYLSLWELKKSSLFLVQEGFAMNWEWSMTHPSGGSIIELEM